MKPRGLTFTGESVLGLLTCAQCGTLSPGICPECGSAEKLKSQTRRVITDQLPPDTARLVRHGDVWLPVTVDENGAESAVGDIGVRVRSPCQPGDIVYAKEALEAMPHYVGEDYEEGDGYVPPPPLTTTKYLATLTAVPYAVGAEQGWCGKAMWQWKRKRLSPRHMPRWAARIWLEITDVRAQRLRDIREWDACAEGIVYDDGADSWFYGGMCLGLGEEYDSARTAFLVYWDSRYKKWPERQSAAKPWVWVYRLKPNSREAAEDAEKGGER